MPLKVKKLDELEGLITNEAPRVPSRVITLGRVLSCLEGMKKREALWVLRKCIRELGGK